MEKILVAGLIAILATSCACAVSLGLYDQVLTQKLQIDRLQSDQKSLVEMIEDAQCIQLRGQQGMNSWQLSRSIYVSTINRVPRACTVGSNFGVYFANPF